MPTPSGIQIKVEGVDITSKVLFSTARFEAQLGAVPGTAELTAKDPDQTLLFTTGDELTLDIDGTRMWGGYITNVARTFAFAAVDTRTPATVKTRQWKLTALDYNVLFDKRVINNPNDYLSALPYFTLDRTMGELLRDELFAKYLDIGSDGLDTTTYVDDTYVPRFDGSGNPDPDATKSGTWPQQGSYWRAAMDDFGQFGVIYYIDPAKNVHFHEVETTAAPWGFSDKPNKNALPSVGATYGMREFEEIASADAMANESFVWGGSEFSGASGGTVFGHASNATSITDHRRWQYAETRFGDLRNQGEVTARANVIVSGTTTGASGGDTNRGLSVEQKQVRLAWFAHDVPTLSGNRVHLKPSDVVPMTLNVLGDSGSPLELVLPLRTLRISFPTLPSSGSSHATPKTYVRFDGYFGLQLSDPYWLWKFLRDLRQSQVATVPVATSGNSATASVYGAFGEFVPSPLPDSSTTTFAIPFAYIAGSLQVYLDTGSGYALLARGLNFDESSPENGEFLMATAPSTGDKFIVICRVAGGI